MGNLVSVILAWRLVGYNVSETKTPNYNISQFEISKAKLSRTDSCESDEYTLFGVPLNEVDYLTQEIDIR
jgi:hypothetical protein